MVTLGKAMNGKSVELLCEHITTTRYVILLFPVPINAKIEIICTLTEVRFLVYFTQMSFIVREVIDLS